MLKETLLNNNNLNHNRTELEWKVLDYEEGYHNCQYLVQEHLTCAKTGKLTLLLNLVNKEQKWVCSEHQKFYINESQLEKDNSSNLVQIQGTLTSGIRAKASTDTPYYCFFRKNDDNKHSLTECVKSKCQECEIPIIFRLNSPAKPILEKNNQVILQGNWAKSDHSSRPSFTVYSFQKLNERSPWAFNKDHE